MLRTLKGLIVAKVGTTLRIELENGLKVETKDSFGHFKTYQPVNVYYNFERGEVTKIVKPGNEAVDEINCLECNDLPVEECPNDDDTWDHFNILVGADYSDAPAGSENLAPFGAELGALDE